MYKSPVLAGAVSALVLIALIGCGGSGGTEVRNAWARHAGSAGDVNGYGVASYADGSSVVTGYFEMIATFGAGETGETMLTSAGGEDVFVARYNADGTLAWAKRAGGTATNERGGGIAAYADGSSVVTGFFAGTATFGAGEAGATTLISAGEDVFVARYNADGTLAWAKRAGGTGGDAGQGIAAHADGSSVVTGSFSGTATFGATTLTSAGSNDLFVARYNADGTLAWAKRAGGSNGDRGRAIAAHADGSSVVTGRFSGSATFGVGEPNVTTLISSGSFDIVVARYNADGMLAWAKRAGSSGSDQGRGIAAHTDGSSVVTGSFAGSATFGPGEPGAATLTSGGAADLFVARYNADGTLAWAKRAGGTGTDLGLGIAAYADGASVVTGSFLDTATFGPGESNVEMLTAPGLGDVFVARYNADGTLAFAKHAGGAGFTEGSGIAAYADGSSVTAGYFEGSATFGAGETNETTLTSGGDEDLFVARYNADGGF